MIANPENHIGILKQCRLGGLHGKIMRLRGSLDQEFRRAGSLHDAGNQRMDGLDRCHHGDFR